MRKKELIKQNTTLFEELQDSKRTIEDLKEQLNENAAKLSELQKKLSELKEKGEENQNQVTEEQKDTEEIKISEETGNGFKANDYGAKVIGSLVLKASEFCTQLGTDTANRERINLILGRTEVAKADILAVCTGNDEPQIQMKKIDNIKDVAIDYFESVMTQ